MSRCECGCGNEARSGRRFIQGHQHNGANNPSWGGGRFVRRDGYVALYDPHAERGDGTHILEHLAVARTALGRPVPETAVVHHVNEDRSDNRPANLVICEDRAYHNLLHRRMRAREACGNPNWLKCGVCKKYDAPEAMYVGAAGRGGRSSRAYHRACKAAQVAEHRRKNGRKKYAKPKAPHPMGDRA